MDHIIKDVSSGLLMVIIKLLHIFQKKKYYNSHIDMALDAQVENTQAVDRFPR